MADNSLNLFDECVAEYIHLCPQKEEYTCSSWRDSKIYKPGIVTDSLRMSTKINKNGAIGKVSFSGTGDTIKHLKTFKIFSN